MYVWIFNMTRCCLFFCSPYFLLVMSDNRSFRFSSIIKTVVEKSDHGEASSKDDLQCTACEMLVSWVTAQLKQEGTKESVLNYVNQVIN